MSFLVLPGLRSLRLRRRDVGCHGSAPIRARACTRSLRFCRQTYCRTRRREAEHLRRGSATPWDGLRRVRLIRFRSRHRARNDANSFFWCILRRCAAIPRAHLAIFRIHRRRHGEESEEGQEDREEEDRQEKEVASRAIHLPRDLAKLARSVDRLASVSSLPVSKTEAATNAIGLASRSPTDTCSGRLTATP